MRAPSLRAVAPMLSIVVVTHNSRSAVVVAFPPLCRQLTPEDELIVVQDGDRAFGGKVRGVISTHGGDKGKSLLVDDSLLLEADDNRYLTAGGVGVYSSIQVNVRNFKVIAL